jgi:hypothetical protein
MRNHYLHSVKSAASIQSCHNMRFPIIADSGANFHMFKECKFFESITPTTGRIFLGDGTTTLDTHGIGTVCCTLGSNTVILENIRYVSGLAESIYSLFLHMKQPGHGLKSSYDTGLQILFLHSKLLLLLGGMTFTLMHYRMWTIM